MMTTSKTQNINQTMIPPILSTKQYRLETQKNKPQKALYMSGTTEGDLLHKQLLKECQKTSKLIQISNLMTQPLQGKREKVTKKMPITSQKEENIKKWPPITLPRRNPGNTRKPTGPHPAAAAAAAPPQKKPPPTPHSPKATAKIFESPNRNTRLTRFKPGFEEQTELELSRAFLRPPRTYQQDPPFYPWLPIEPKVNFTLIYNG